LNVTNLNSVRGLRFIGISEPEESPLDRIQHITGGNFTARFLFDSFKMGRGWKDIFYPPREELLLRLNHTLKGKKNGEPQNWRGIRPEDRIDNPRELSYSGVKAKRKGK
jgi:hypothetical protein